MRSRPKNGPENADHDWIAIVFSILDLDLSQLQMRVFVLVVATVSFKLICRDI